MEQPKITPAIEKMTAEVTVAQQRHMRCICVIIHPGQPRDDYRDRCGSEVSVDQPFCEPCEAHHRGRADFTQVPLHMLQAERAKK